MILDNLTQPLKDPILSLMAECQADQRTQKVDLGLGVYRDASGQTPVMTAVKKAEARLLDQQASKSYVGPAGSEAFNSAMIELILGDNASKSRAVGVQTPGASGALKLLADVIKQSNPGATVWLTDLSYANHATIMQAAGLAIRYFPYFDQESKLVNEVPMLEALSQAGPNDVVLLHGCCHNPTGADLSLVQWQAITELALKQGFLPFIDIAYQGFGDGMDADVEGFRYLAERVESYVVASSCSKNFGLYRERTGIAMVAGSSLQQSQIIKARLMERARTTYTMPPDHGGAIVEMILNDAVLKQEWLHEVEQMRTRVHSLRQQLAHAFAVRSHSSAHYDFITQHKGMFSVLGIHPQQVERLAKEFGIYLVGSGRINVAGMKESQIAYIADSLLAV